MRPTNKEVYILLMILKYIVVHSITTPRQEIPMFFPHWSKEVQEDFDNKLKKEAEEQAKRMEEAGLWEHTSPLEKKFLLSYGSKMDEYAHLAAYWRMECTGMLMWALDFIKEWPKIDEEINPELFKGSKIVNMEYLNNPPSLRAEDEISLKRNLIEFWHWRVRTQQLIKEGRRFESDEAIKKLGLKSYDDIVRFSAKTAHEKGTFSEIIDEDFVFIGKAFRELNEDEYETAKSIIMERHFALNWLCGMAPANRWDETPTDT
jgi:hypothetical protein